MENDARSLDQKTQAEYRRRAHILHMKGKSRQEIADLFGVHLKTVDRWRADHKRQGADALRPKKRGRQVGTDRHLTSDQEKKIQKTAESKAESAPCFTPTATTAGPTPRPKQGTKIS